ncbi:MAG: NAD(P) transhydrogenase subunit alpha [Spirochaetaceae bacterium]|nr:NAD(P) transhydrogenase subunit alpha [Spirochaetaceae bacterium]
MRIFVPRETEPGEPRAAVTPDTVQRYGRKDGAVVAVESGAGAGCHFSDDQYREAGAEVVTDRTQELGKADIILRVRRPPDDEISAMKKGAIHISFLDPFNEPELIDALAGQGVSAISVELVPRSTRAQKLDALSSQHNIAGYAMVVLAAERLGAVMPMMMTPSGTLQPARAFIIGAGVAGLQAIATAKRLGARVEAFDTRPVVEEQVKSLGAKFIKVDLGETGQTDQGYAKELTEEQLAKQRELMADTCAGADIVITTAQLFGRKAPVVLSADVVERMKAGAVVVDYAVESGGNVEGSVAGQETQVNGVTIIGLRNIPGRYAVSASSMYANNLYNYVDEFWDDESKGMKLDREDEIIAGSLVTHDGQMVNEMVRKITSG